MCDSVGVGAMADGWVMCDWRKDTLLEPILLSFFGNCPQDCSGIEPDDVDVHRCVTCFTNDVIRIRIKGRQDVGFILKMVPVVPKVSVENMTLPSERGQTEFTAFNEFNALVPGCAPTPLFYDRENRILCTRELSLHQPLSGAVLRGEFSARAARALARTLATLHADTHVTAVGQTRLRGLQRLFPAQESMMTLIRTYHFERPFDPCEPGRRCHPDVLRMLPEVLGDASVIRATAEVKRSFMDDLECLVHGDLHIESVLVNDEDIKIIDAEFARVGPCAYDLGLLLATLLMVLHRYRHVVRPRTRGGRGHDTANASQQGEGEDEEVRAIVEQGYSPQEQSRNTASSVELKSPSSKSTPLDETFGNGRCQKREQLHQYTDVKSISVETMASKSPDLKMGCEGEEDNGLTRQQTRREDSETSVPTAWFCGVEDRAAEDSLLQCAVLLQEYTATLGARLHSRQEERDQFQLKLLRDVAAFAGCEMLACVIGPSHMDFMDSSPPAQVDCVRSALHLLRQKHSIRCVDDFVRLLSYQP